MSVFLSFELELGPRSGCSSNPPGVTITESRLWWLGVALMILGEVGNFMAYGFAPAKKMKSRRAGAKPYRHRHHPVPGPHPPRAPSVDPAGRGGWRFICEAGEFNSDCAMEWYLIRSYLWPRSCSRAFPSGPRFATP